MAEIRLLPYVIAAGLLSLTACGGSSTQDDNTSPPINVDESIQVDEIVYDIESGINDKLNKEVLVSGHLYISNSDNTCPSFCRTPEEITDLTDEEFTSVNSYAPYTTNGDCRSSRIELRMDEHIIPIDNVELKSGSYVYSDDEQQTAFTGRLVAQKTKDYCHLTEHPSVRLELSQQGIDTIKTIIEGL